MNEEHEAVLNMIHDRAPGTGTPRYTDVYRLFGDDHQRAQRVLRELVALQLVTHHDNGMIRPVKQPEAT